MLLFLLSLMPLAFCFYWFYKKDRQIIIPALIGILFAVIVCAFKSFFTFSHRIIPYSFGQNFLFVLSRDVLYPLIFYGLFFAISRDSVEYKIKSFFSLICPFEMIYMPYCVISATESVVYSGYDIFIYPLIVLASLIEIALNVNYLYQGFTKKNYKIIFLNIPLLLFYLVFPCVIYSFRLMDFSSVLTLIVSIIYTVCPYVYYGYKLIKN